MFLYHRIAFMGNSTNSLIILFYLDSEYHTDCTNAFEFFWSSWGQGITHIFVCFILTLCLKCLPWLLFFNQLVCCTWCHGEFLTLRSTMKLQIPHGFLKRFALKVIKTISKSQHRRFQSRSRRYWLFKIVFFFMFHVCVRVCVCARVRVCVCVWPNRLCVCSRCHT